MTSDERRVRLQAARLYLICDARPGGRALRDVLGPALAGGVDVFQLRDKTLADDELLEAAATARELCTHAGALFFVNDRPDLAVAARADGVHVGQDDMPVERARAIVGRERLVGLSTHTPAQIDEADPARVDLIGVGPVHATPTKEGRPAVGPALVRYAAQAARVPFFAIGGIDETTLPVVLEAGARRISVVRAIAGASDPGAAARRLRSMVESTQAAAVGGPAQP